MSWIKPNTPKPTHIAIEINPSQSVIVYRVRFVFVRLKNAKFIVDNPIFEELTPSGLTSTKMTSNVQIKKLTSKERLNDK